VIYSNPLFTEDDQRRYESDIARLRKARTEGSRLNRTIIYGIEPDGTVISRVGSEVAFPVLDFQAIGQGGEGYEPGDFRGPEQYSLEKSGTHFFFRYEECRYSDVKWTKGFGNTHGTPPIPLDIRNIHRVFWGFKPLKEKS